jgi:hypothetical protein
MFNRTLEVIFSPAFRSSVTSYVPGVASVTRGRYWTESCLVLIGAWLLFLPYVTQRTFLDEFDNIVGGNVVVHGGSIYGDYLSQHMPVSYWISALGQLLGATSIEGQRIFGFGIFSLLLAVLYLRNARTFGRIPLLVVAISVPLLHFANPNLSYAILSDNYQALAYLFVLFEVVRIGIYPRNTILSWLTIGIFGALSLGVAFVSAYYLAASVVTAALLEIVNFSRTRRSLSAWLAQIGRRIGVLISPFLLVLIAIWVSGALPNAYQQAYLLNTTTYSKYIGGFGSNVLTPFSDGLLSMLGTIFRAPGNVIGNPGWLSFRVAFFLTVLLVLILLLVRIRPILAIGLFGMACLAGTRGWTGFHAQPLWLFLIGCLGLLAWMLFASGWFNGRHSRMVIIISSLVLAIAFILSAGPYAQNVFRNRHVLLTPLEYPNPSRTKVIETLVPEGGMYAEFGINNVYDFVNTRRLPAGGFAAVVPWFSDMLDEEMAQRLALDDPILVFSDPANEVWGKNVNSHAPLLTRVVEAGYTRIDLESIGVTEGVYIRNSALDVALAELRQAFPGAQISIRR